MFRRSVAIVLLLLLPQTAAAEASSARAQETAALTDAVVIALVIAGSIAAYKAMGKPCACPKDLMKNGRVCGGNSAWSRPGGYKPLCFPTDVTPAMINAYRATKTIPALK
jgi:hypothetical protein